MMRFTISVILFLYLANANAQLTNKLQSIFTKYQTVGMSVTVVKNDSLIYGGYFGKRDIGRNLPVNAQTMYRIASISKFITATALLTLYDEGKFRLDDDVNNYLGWQLRNPAFPNEPITFRKLLSHTSSLRDGTGYDNFLSLTASVNPPPPLSNLLTTSGASYTANMFSSTYGPQHSYFQYANINFGVIGTLVEKLSQQRFDVYVRNKILLPLGISGSFNVQDIAEINNVAALYRKSGSIWVAQTDNFAGVKPTARDLSGYTIGSNGIVFSPTGGLRISAADLSRFMMLHMNKGITNGVRILSDSTAGIMHKANWTYNGSNGNNYYGIFNSYSMGCHITTDLLQGESMLGHPGEAYGLISDLYFSPAKKFGIIFITNGAVWGNGTYSGWYNIEEEVYTACLQELPNLTSLLHDGIIGSENFAIQNCYPNPFNPTTTVQFSIAGTSLQNVSLKVYDVTGREVATLLDGKLPGGKYSAKVDLSNQQVSSGIYFCRLHSGNFTAATKMVLLK